MRTRRVFTAEEKATAVEKYKAAKEEGGTLRSVAERIGVSVPNLHRWLLESEPKPKRKQFPIELKHQAVAMFNGGMRAADVAEKLGCDARRVRNWGQHGIKRGANGSEPAQVIAKTKDSSALNDLLIYVAHAERAVMQMMRDGKASRLDKAHRLILLAAECAAEVSKK